MKRSSHRRHTAKSATSLVLCLLLAACSGSATHRPARHPTYAYEASAPPSVWRADDTITIHWTPHAAGSLFEDQPTPIKLELQVYGPFNTATAQETHAHHPDTLESFGTHLTTSTVVDDWSGVPRVSILELPHDLTAGLYVVALRTEDRRVSGTSTFTVTVEGT